MRLLAEGYIRGSALRTSRRARLGLLFCGALALGGCSTVNPFGSGSSESSASGAPQGGGSSLSNLLKYGSTQAPAVVKEEDDRTYSCPKVEILEGTAGYRSGGNDGSSTSVSYQASIGELARECRILGSTMTLRVGVEGRVLLGPQGKPGTYSVPVRVVVKKDDKVMFSRAVRISVTVPPNDTQAVFDHIEEGISLPVGATDPGTDYNVLVGFDPSGGGTAGRDPARRRRG
jgi:hypothetical protein